MSRLEPHVLAVIFATLLLSFLLPSAIPVEGVSNPVNDLAAVFGITIPSSGLASSGTSNSGSNPSNVQQAASRFVGCGSAAIGTGAVGAGIGAIGIVTIPIGFVAGAVIGLASCFLLPGPTQTVGNLLINFANQQSGGLGDFFRGVVGVMGFIGGLISFGPDWIIYQSALMAADPTTALFLAPYLAYSIAILSLYGIKIARGVGMLG